MTADAERLAAIRSERIRAIRSRVVDLEGFPTSPRFGAGDMALVLAELDALRALIEAAIAQVESAQHMDDKYGTHTDRRAMLDVLTRKSAALAGDQPEATPERLTPHEGAVAAKAVGYAGHWNGKVSAFHEQLAAKLRRMGTEAAPEPPHLDPEGSNG